MIFLQITKTKKISQRKLAFYFGEHMSNNYKFKRDWENAEKAIYDGEGEFDIPIIAPENYHNVEWIGFNKATATQNEKIKVFISF